MNLFFYFKELSIFFLIMFSVILFFSILFSNQLGLYSSQILSSLSLFLLSYSFIYLLFFFKNSNYFIVMNILNWFYLINNNIEFSLYLDTLSISFAALTTNIGFFVTLYIFSYFRGEPQIPRLYNLIISFILSMTLLVLAKNLIVLFLGWELIGFTSFLLINFWVYKIGTLKSSLKAFFFNRFSDSFILLFIMTNYLITNSFEIEVSNFNYFLFLENDDSDILKFYENLDLFEDKEYIEAIQNKININYNKNLFDSSFKTSMNFGIDFILLFMILGSGVKSAQLIGHLWLPDSMEAPVPASALIHSATLVSAGVYLILRFNILFTMSKAIYNIVFFWGAVTSIYGGIIAASQMDLKRTLAYSTISHCGNMVLLASLGLVDFSLLYLYTHGFFKAISFLCVGNIIRFYKNIQDLRKMGMSSIYQFGDSFLILISIINLGGLPLTLGFYIKHFLLITVNSESLNYYLITISILTLTSLTGFIYAFKIVYNVMFDSKKGNINFYLKLELKNLNDKAGHMNKEKSSILFTSFKNLINSIYSSNSFINYFLISISLFSSYIVIFNLYKSSSCDYTEGFNNIYWLKESKSLIYNTSITRYNFLILLNLLLLLLDYWLTSLWRGLINRSNGKYYLYIVILPIVIVTDFMFL